MKSRLSIYYLEKGNDTEENKREKPHEKAYNEKNIIEKRENFFHTSMITTEKKKNQVEEKNVAGITSINSF